MLPQVNLVGRLTRDSELTFLPNQTALASFSVATNEKYGEKEYVCYLNCVIFGKQAEALHKYFTKGKPIQLSGKLKTESWTDKDSGSKRSKIVFGVDKWSFVPQDKTEQAGQANPNYVGENPAPPPDDKIPF